MNKDIHFKLIKSKRRRKTISLHIKEDGTIVIHAPYRTSNGEVEKFIKEKDSWIIEKISEREKRIKEVEKAFLPGEKFLYLGESYPLQIDKSNTEEPPLKLSFGHFILNEDHIEEARELFILWYKRQAKEKIVERTYYYSSRLQLFPEAIRITSANCRWGSCSRDNRLSFAWRVIMAPLPVIDYILIHELVHIREKNHSKRFWNYLESILPDYRKHRYWLRENEHSLRLDHIT